jgi:branched-chain amino acid aminotransferase
VYKDGSLVTPLSDSILPGITRDSVLALAEGRGHTVTRRPVTIQEWRDGVASGDIVEAFACGTAAMITPIGQIKAKDFTIGSPDAVPGELTLSLRAELTDIQYGRREDAHGWMYRLDA